MTTTPPSSRPLRLLLVGLASLPLLGVLGACSPAESPGADPGAASSTATSGATAADEDVPPLDAFLGVDAESDDVSGDAARYRELQEAIARCMSGEGFEYVPEEFLWGTGEGGQSIETSDPTFPELPPDQFAARFGYGHSTVPRSERQDPVDLNKEIVDEMSVAERVAYFGALYGPTTPLTDAGYVEASVETTEGSCTGRASRSIPSDDEVQSMDNRVQRVRTSFASLLRRIDELRDQEQLDPRVASATKDWSGCLAASGLPGFGDIEAPQQKSLADARALLGPDLDSAGVDPTQLAALRQAEISLAVADQQCRIAWDATFLEVQRDLEEQFVRANVKELESFRSAMSAAQR